MDVQYDWVQHYKKHTNTLVGLNQRAGDDNSLIITAIKTARKGGCVDFDGL
jgi:hypothetical protein